MTTGFSRCCLLILIEYSCLLALCKYNFCLSLSVERFFSVVCFLLFLFLLLLGFYIWARRLFWIRLCRGLPYFPQSTEGRSAFLPWQERASSQPMCWLKGPAHIHMFPVCLAQQDTGWLHALLIIPTAHALQGRKPNPVIQHTLVNIMVSTALEIRY